jgi:endo-1,4-beta-D-glucanase Y
MSLRLPPLDVFLLSFLSLSAATSACAVAPTAGGTGGDGTGDTGGAPGGGAGGTISGMGGSVATIVMKDPSTYPQNAMSAGAHFPYPQGHALAHCMFPAYNTDSVETAYNNWKTKFYQGGRVASPENAGETFSEGIAYGMLIAVYMNDRAMFDTLWAYAQSKSAGGFMNWRISASGGVLGMGGATDADEDMAWALLMADKQWGGTYKTAAVTLINNIWNREVDQGGGNVLKPGDNFGGANQTNPSYFAPSYYRVFAKVTTNNWMAVVESSYSILGKAMGTNGLVPNWVNSQGVGVAGSNNDAKGPYFGYDACRTPWRIALDYCEYGEPRALAYMEKIAPFYISQSTTGLGGIKDGYTTAGGPPPAAVAPLGTYAAGMAFFGPGGVAAMGGGHTAFVSTVYTALSSNTTGPSMNIGGVFTYFHASWGLLSLLTMSGNFWNMAP